MNKTNQINQEAKRKIEKIVAHDIWWLDEQNKWRLWKIRDSMKHFFTQEQLDDFVEITDDNNNDINEFLERHNWF